MADVVTIHGVLHDAGVGARAGVLHGTRDRAFDLSIDGASRSPHHAMPGGAARQPSLHDQVASRLRTMLIEGAIAPGAKLNERALSERLQVSRTPLREAIKALAAEGLVDLLPNRGAVAVKLDEEDVVHTFELLATLEGLSGELAATRATDDERAEIRALHFEMRACHARHDLSGYYGLNARIHRAINAAAGNPVLAATYASVNARVQALRFRTNQDGKKWKQAVREHEAMVEALDARDAAGLRRVLIEHLHHKRDMVLELLRAGEVYPADAA